MAGVCPGHIGFVRLFPEALEVGDYLTPLDVPLPPQYLKPPLDLIKHPDDFCLNPA